MKSRGSKITVNQDQSPAAPTRREFLDKSSVMAAGVLAGLALSGVAQANNKDTVLLSLDKTVLVCVTGKVPTGELAQVTLAKAYQLWLAGASGLAGFVRPVIVRHDPMKPHTSDARAYV